jgi:5-(carboxyamino)imidazole ribonucleotide synthase
MKIGVIGGGQLGRMLATAGAPLALGFRFLDPSPDAPAGQVAPLVPGRYDDPRALARLARDAELITYEFENVPVQALKRLSRRRTCLPPADALRVSQDRLYEKDMFQRLGIPTPEYRAVDSLEDLRRGVRDIGLPCVLKTRRLGYDGRGQAYLRKAADLEPAWAEIGGVPLILEGFVDFDREVSIIGARSTTGEVKAYPLAWNTHRAGILRTTIAPLRARQLNAQALRYLRRVLAEFDYAGVLTLEFFVRGGRLIANEMAPRVHNSGHWTIEGAATSQFENHLRAILGLPLGDTRALGHAAMVNFIGEMPAREPLLALPGVHFHDYGKEPRAGRKLGHCTILAATTVERDRLLRRVLRLTPGR